MGYSSALVAAGCEVLEFEEFGDYQGSWYALVKLDNEIGLVEGSYGSCSGCDAFEGELGYCDSDKPGYLPPLPIDLRIEQLTESIKKYDWNDDSSALRQLLSWKAQYNL
jgi:hypothetical protein